MTSYIYLSSDASLPCSEINEYDIRMIRPAIYFTHTSMKYFFFKGNFDSEKQCFVSYSKHFTELKYQVASINLKLPYKNVCCISQKNKIALHELFNYIMNHLKNSQATYIEILFCLKGSEENKLNQFLSIEAKNLSVDDLYYEELKMLRIDSDKIAVLLKRKIA